MVKHPEIIVDIAERSRHLNMPFYITTQYPTGLWYVFRRNCQRRAYFKGVDIVKVVQQDLKKEFGPMKPLEALNQLKRYGYLWQDNDIKWSIRQP